MVNGERAGEETASQNDALFGNSAHPAWTRKSKYDREVRKTEQTTTDKLWATGPYQKSIV